ARERGHDRDLPRSGRDRFHLPARLTVPRRSLDDPVTAITGINAAYGGKLERVGVKTVRDLLLYFPRKHRDFGNVTPIAWVRPGMQTTVRARVYHIARQLTPRKHMQIARATVSDDSGQLNVVWFNQPYIANYLREGDQIFLAGEVDLNGGLVMKNPDYEKASSHPSHAARIDTMYPERRGIALAWLGPNIQPLR